MFCFVVYLLFMFCEKWFKNKKKLKEVDWKDFVRLYRLDLLVIGLGECFVLLIEFKRLSIVKVNIVGELMKIFMMCFECEKMWLMMF